MPNANRSDAIGDCELIDPALVTRFRDDLVGLAGQGEYRIGAAVSGGPDSMAMLALAAAAFPGRVEAATVDHGLRAAAADEAALVGRFCDGLGVPHRTLRVSVVHAASIQAAARDARYAALIGWAQERSLDLIVTAHHADDQAETMLMRLSRGAGLAGLTGIRANRAQDGIRIVRPLLGWRKAELGAIAAQIETIDDPSNEDPRHDRTHIRRLLAADTRLDAARFAAAAHHLAEAEEALAWVTREAIRSRCVFAADGSIEADLEGLPRDLQRRILAQLIETTDSVIDGPTLERVIESIAASRKSSVSGLQITPGRRIRLEKAPPRR